MKRIILLALLAASPALASDFTAFAEDEATCRTTGTAAIAHATGPAAAQRYDRAYGACMFAHGRTRARNFYAQQPPAGPPDAPSTSFPDAYYSVPYATPGYGYDGFSY